MEVEEIQAQGCKFPRIGNGRSDIGQKGEEHCPDDEDDGDVKRNGVGFGRLCGWPSSRIVRVSRASGGKDRHSKVWTSKGLRDRRVRLSVPTAIQFYDLQDRLGYDQPSKAVEWLLKAAASSITELPSINTSFPDTPKQLSGEKRSTVGREQVIEYAEAEFDGDPNYPQQQQQQHVSLSKSACSSNSETSKGSGLSLSRSESRIKARERARERTAAERENQPNVNHNTISQSSFTELLTCGINSIRNSTSPNNESGDPQEDCEQQNQHFFRKSNSRQWPISTTSMDYFSHHSSSSAGFTIPHPAMTVLPPFSLGGGGDHQQHFSFIPDHIAPAASGGGGGGGSDYNLNFTISSGLAGFNRGTLQSNSPSHQIPNNLQRFSLMDGSSNVPFFIGTTAAAPPPPPNANAAAAAHLENHHHHHQQHNHHQFPSGLDGRLQLCYGDGGGRQSDQKGKGKN